MCEILTWILFSHPTDLTDLSRLIWFIHVKSFVCRAMGNTDSVVVQKRLAHFRPDERPVIEGIFDRLHGSAAGKTGNVLTLDMLKVSRVLFE